MYRYVALVILSCLAVLPHGATGQPVPDVVIGNDNLRFPNTGAGIYFPGGSFLGTATLKGAPGPEGSQGPQGAVGQTGPKGSPGRAYTRTALVSPVGSPQQNGSALAEAINHIIVSGNPSADNPWLLKLEPGIYDLQGSSLWMTPYIDVEGSGENTTVITGTIGNYGVVRLANNAELRFLTVRNTGGGTNATAVYAGSVDASARASNITATAAGGTYNAGIVTGSAASPTLTDVTAVASGGTYAYGANIGTGSAIVARVRASASGGTNNYGINISLSSPVLIDVTATATGGTGACGIQVYRSAATLLRVTASASGGSSNNYGIWIDGPLTPTLTDIMATATGTGTSQNVGIKNDQVSLVLTRAVIKVTGGTSVSYGINNWNSTIVMTDVTIIAEASTGGATIGIQNYDTSATMTNVTAMAKNGSAYNHGMYNNHQSGGPTNNTISADRCTFSGTTSIFNYSTFTVNVGQSKLSGPINTANGGTLTCVNSYNAGYTALTGSCQ